MASQIKVILFDLGGVLVELDQRPEKTCWFDPRLTREENWNTWLTSSHVQQFERGEIGSQDFAERFVADHRISLTPAQFLEQFNSWIVGFYPDAFSLLRRLSANYILGIFSNISEAHWNIVYPPIKQCGYISHYFASYQIGQVKPDPSAFAFIAGQIAVSPESILFLDDNALNVVGAREAGYRAHVAKGVQAAVHILNRYGILEEVSELTG